MQVKRQEIAAMRLFTSALKRRLHHAGIVALQSPRRAQPGCIGNGLDIKYE